MSLLRNDCRDDDRYVRDNFEPEPGAKDPYVPQEAPVLPEDELEARRNFGSQSRSSIFRKST